MNDYLLLHALCYCKALHYVMDHFIKYLVD